tara:strand:- start:9193 stop:10329 length:1137 start_codon:yes stop_codon:yes gene_type:complete
LFRKYRKYVKMDDFNINVLSEAKNEYMSRLINLITPLVLQGFRSILKEAKDLCIKNNEHSKYLMTFQNFLTRVPKWNQEIINIETNRIIQSSNCSYLEDLLTCVHITQLKVLTSIRVSSQQKKIDIDIPKLGNFIHKVYIDSARKIYQNVYLFENDILPLLQQKNMRETEIIIKESILNVIRSSMPIEQILRAYIDETEEEEVFEEIIEKKVETPVEESTEAPVETAEETTNNLETSEPNNDINGGVFVSKNDTTNDTISEVTHDKPSSLSFNDNDNIVNFKKEDAPGIINTTSSNLVTAPKTIERLEQLSEDRYNKRKEEEEEDEDYDDDEENVRLQIFDGENKVKLDNLDIHDLNDKKDELVLNDVDELKGLDLLS